MDNSSARMSSIVPQTSDFFISYSGADRAWAEWIAYQLEAQGLTVTLQRDFNTSATVIGEIDKALAGARHALLLCSQAYFRTSAYTTLEYQAALNRELQDPTRACIALKIDANLPLRDVPDLLKAKIIQDLSATGDETTSSKILMASICVAPGLPTLVPTNPHRPSPPFPVSPEAITEWEALRSVRAHCEAFR